MNDYPVNAILPELREALVSARRVVLEAPPGAGKTTVVPLALLDADWLGGRKLVMLEPRRLAARAAAARMASLLGEAVGGTVGYRVRFDQQVSAATRIEVVTEGILTRRLQSDPELADIGLLLFDEFHERNLHSDLALALARDVQGALRPDLRLLVMSATLDGEALARQLGARRVRSEGRSFPVSISYLPADPAGSTADAVVTAVRRALAEHRTGDVLAFLPGAGEIRRAAEALAGSVGDDGDVRPLYGDMALEAQTAAIAPAPAGRRKVVLATNIAETSLTIEGVTVVVDSGFERSPRFDPRTGMTRLETVRIPRASADQRAGRAGRLGPGHCYRLWSEATQRGLVPFGRPEIATADLAPLALDLSVWGADAADLEWIDPPPAGALAQARELLQELGALDCNGRVTAVGRGMARLPLHPRLSHMLHTAAEPEKGTACDVAALLSERDLFRDRVGGAACEFRDRLAALVAFRDQGAAGARREGADPAACRAVERAARQWRRLLKAERQPVDAGAVGPLLARAYPDRIARNRRDDPSRYRLANGRGAVLARHCPLAGERYLVAATLDDAGSEARVRLAAPLAEAALRELAGERLNTTDEVTWDSVAGRIVSQRVVRFGALELEASRLDQPDPARVQEALMAGLRQEGAGALPWSSAARELQARILFLREVEPEAGWPDVADAALLDGLDEWLAPYLHGVRSREELKRIDLAAALQARLDWNRQQRLEQDAPAAIAVPSGHRRRIRYSPGEAPVLAVKLQELFGLADTPRLAGGRVPLTLELLSPAGRPVQVTRDLKSFWSQTYPEVCKELRGRYPKHPWPDDPWSAKATAGTRRRPGR